MVTVPTRGGSGEATAGGERAEFYLCLARAFMPPATEEAYRGLTCYLADDLTELGERLGYPVDGALGDLRAALAEVPDPLSLLQLYSKLFLTPPAPVSLNAGLYLDGTLLGASVLAMERHYRCHGVERAASFHDLPDHVALQLEFVALLLGRAAACARQGDHGGAAAAQTQAEAFLATFVRPWLPALCASLDAAMAAHGRASPYLHLARLLRVAVEQDTAAIGVDAASAMHPVGEPTAEQLQEIARLLSTHGLATEHLAVPLAARDASMGLTALTPPREKRTKSDPGCC